VSRAGRNPSEEKMAQVNEAHPAQVELAKVFSSVTLLGPRMSVELVKLVAHLFTPDEADVARVLPFYKPRSIEAVARKTKRSVHEIKPLLEACRERRTIYGGSKGYSLMPIIPGMFEYMLMGGIDTEWHRTYAALLEDVIETGYLNDYTTKTIPAVRNIPIQRTIEEKSHVVDADLLSAMIEAHADLAVLNVCQCRQVKNFTDKKCKRSSPQDGCLVFGAFAKAAIDSRDGRAVTKEEMKAIAEERWKRNLVFLAANVSPDSPNAVCTCCDCCCHFLGAVNKYNGMTLMANSHFIAEVDEALCNECGKCALVCNTFAHGMKDKKHLYDHENCIGCGVCVESCKEKAIHMVENPKYKRPPGGYRSLGVKLLGPVALSGLRAMIKR